MSLLLHSDNPTTSLGHPHDYRPFLRPPPQNANLINTTKSHSTNFTDDNEGWLLDDDALVLAEPSYVDRLLGLHHHSSPTADDEISRALLLAAGNNESTVNISDTNTGTLFFGGRSHLHLRHLCRQALIQRIPEVGVRYWDAFIFLANLLFLLFLVAKLAYLRRRPKLRSFSRMSGNATLKQFFVLLFALTLLNMAHAVGSAAFTLTDQIGSLVDQAVWFALKFCLFTLELCILFFGFCFGQVHSARTACCGLLISLTFALLHSAFQSTFDFRLWDEYINLDPLRAYLPEEINFWVLSSIVIATIYLILGLVQVACCRHSLYILHRCPMFAYCLVMASLNYAQAFGALLIRMDCPDGLCVVDLVTLVYFTLYAPLVYFLFLRVSAKSEKTRLFSYRTHKTDVGSEANGYYPRFSGLISPSYDDLFDYDRIMRHDENTQMENIMHLNYDFYHNSPSAVTSTGLDHHHYNHYNPNSYNIPLMTRTPDSTLTTQMDSSDGGLGGGVNTSNHAGDMSTSSETRPMIRAPHVASATSNNNSSSGVSSFRNTNNNQNSSSSSSKKRDRKTTRRDDKEGDANQMRPGKLALRSDGQWTFNNSNDIASPSSPIG